VRQMCLVRDYIAPKFFRISAAELVRALGERNRDIVRRALSDMAEIAIYMPRKVRMAFSLGAPFLRSQLFGPIVLTARRLAYRLFM